jgi:glycosyltransferase involved in cell wall biosynthesis
MSAELKLDNSTKQLIASPQRSPKIAFLIDEMAAISAGGTERQLLQLTEIATKNGLSPYICVLRGTKWLTPDIAGCPVKHFDIASIRSVSGLRALGRAASWMRRKRFDLLQAFFPEANLIGPWIGRLAGVPVILGSRRNLNQSAPGETRNLPARLQWISNLLVDQVVANSEAVLERTIRFERLSRRKICVIYNGIDLNQMRPQHAMRASMRKELGIGDDEILVGNISGLRKIKGVESFVEAAAQVRRISSKLRFVLVGDGDMRPKLERLILKHHLEDAFVLAGATKDVRPYLGAMDIAVLCSSAEGFSNSLLEYMLAGLPIVATDVGGNREALNGAGILVPPGNPEQLATAIESLLDTRTRDNLAAAALKEVRRFDLKVAHDRVGDLLWSHLETKSRRRLSRPRTNMQKIAPSAAIVSRCDSAEAPTTFRQLTCIEP